MNCSMPRSSAGRGPYSIPFQKLPMVGGAELSSRLFLLCLVPRERFVPCLSTVHFLTLLLKDDVKRGAHVPQKHKETSLATISPEDMTFMEMVTTTKKQTSPRAPAFGSGTVPLRPTPSVPRSERESLPSPSNPGTHNRCTQPKHEKGKSLGRLIFHRPQTSAVHRVLTRIQKGLLYSQ